MTVRSVDRSRALFEDAMAAYTDGRYADAIRGLEAYHVSHPSEATASFYLGVSLLMMNRNDEAIVALRDAADRDRGYASDARFFLAKALLRKGEREAALNLLGTIARPSIDRRRRPAACDRRAAAAVGIIAYGTLAPWHTLQGMPSSTNPAQKNGCSDNVRP